MSKVNLRKNKAERRKIRVRSTVFGTLERPRLVVKRSNKYMSAQIIDDETGNTLVATGKESEGVQKGKTKTEMAYEVGKKLAEEAKKKKISKVVFDRGSYQDHGRVKSFAQGARDGGLEF